MASNETLTELQAAKEEIQKSVRDLATLKLTLPLGNPALKKVHTNQFLWLDLGDNFHLRNMAILAKALNSSAARWSGYEKNRYYVETCTIKNDGKSVTMDLDLNPFASPLTKYRDEKLSFIKAYKDATSNDNKEGSNSSSSNSGLKGGEGTRIDNLVKEIVGNETDQLRKAIKIHEWLQRNVQYADYECTHYDTPEKCLDNKSHLNCADTARLTASMMRSAGLDCYVVHRTYNGGHFWVVIEIDGKKYASDQTGSGSEWNTVWARSGRTGNGGYAEYSRKNGNEPDC